MSDLHGCYDQFMQMLELINFSAEDTLFIIGDVVDRGTDPIKLLQYVMSQSNIHLIRGNHEQMMLDALKDGNYSSRHRSLWYRNGGVITEDQFNELKKEKQVEIIAYLHSLPLAIEVQVDEKEYILLHGAPDKWFKRHWDEGKISNEILWNRYEDPENDQEAYPGKIIVVGHTPTPYYGTKAIVVAGDKRIIDCGCVFGYHLACMRLGDEKVWYVPELKGDKDENIAIV